MQSTKPLWALVGSSLALDVLTTYVGIVYLGLVELNGLAATLMGALGLLPGMLLLKVGAVAVAAALVTAVPPRFRGVPPAALGLVWLLVALRNVFVVVRAAQVG